MYFGAHVSIAGGVHHAPLNAAKIGCEVFQMFSRSPQGGAAPKLTSEIVEQFFTNVESKTHAPLHEWVIHAPYYINFASGIERTRHNTIRIVREELERGSILKAKYAMFHPGSAKDVGREEAMKLCIEGIKQVLDGYTGSTQLLIEMSAGAGMVIGQTFEELAELLAGIDHPDLGICFDTAHAFAAGYDLRDEKSVTETFHQFDRIIGVHKLKMSHCNDSKIPLGGHKDRHEHLGKGHIGLDGFQAMISSKKLQHLNLYLETEHDAVETDLRILKDMR